MTTFQNQAVLTFNSRTKTSNIVSGVITDMLTTSKTANKQSYSHGEEITYTIALVNEGNDNLNGIVITDNLGSYAVESQTYVPLTYIPRTVVYHRGGVLQSAPTITSTDPLVFTGISVPAGGSSTLQYTVFVNTKAPLGSGVSIINKVTARSTVVALPVEAEHEIPATQSATLDIVKAITPSSIPENGTLTYTITVSNYGPVALAITDDAVVSDTFKPILTNLSVLYNGAPWTQGTEYEYSEINGLFTTNSGYLLIPAAEYDIDSEGNHTVTPGTGTLVISGTV